MIYVFIGFISYLIGCITAGYFVGRWFYHADIRAEGSGNPGTTNAFRTLGVKAGIATLLIDAAKGVLAVWIGSVLAPEFGAYVAAVFVVFGHNFPFHLRFRGGKGVATSAGVVLFFSPLLILVLLGVFILVVVATKKVSAGSVMAAFAAPFVTWFMHKDQMLVFVIAFLGALLLLRHKSNIQRLLRGEEKNFSWKRRKE
ncbi:MAG: glycerol-3-phosphate 1-O-acyltransferase PlsY [Tissierellia bacterium]|jgi:glycerol-3-phosphate acyltransferase PlsY|nr:glycerol-3-phosphate 1-O-acyltransferase PlsY [Bacillota bacterium]NLK58187.1 glycerol-3-phosphate 1-O-acyltransferase PlsY [Tissierellia bacterium]